jgi:hypothetical protein
MGLFKRWVRKSKDQAPPIPPSPAGAPRNAPDHGGTDGVEPVDLLAVTSDIRPEDLRPASALSNQEFLDSGLRDDIRAARSFHRFLTADPPPEIRNSRELDAAARRSGIPLHPATSSDTAYIYTAQLIEGFYSELIKRIRSTSIKREMERRRIDVREAMQMQGLGVHLTQWHQTQSATSVQPSNVFNHDEIPSPRRLGQLQGQRVGPEDAELLAPAAEQTIEHSLALLFLRLGPPPEPTQLDYSPAGHGGGGAQQ